MFVAELRIVPVGEGSSMEPAMQKAKDAFDASGVEYEVGALGTTFEADSLDKIFDVTKRVHEAVVGSAPRALTELSIDHRRDREETLESLSTVGGGH